MIVHKIFKHTEIKENNILSTHVLSNGWSNLNTVTHHSDPFLKRKHQIRLMLYGEHHIHIHAYSYPLFPSPYFIKK